MLSQVGRGTQNACSRSAHGHDARRTRTPRFGHLWERYADLHVLPRLKTAREIRRKHDRHFAHLDRLPANQITRQHLVELHTEWGRRHGRTSANRILEVIRAVYNWGIRMELVASNPAQHIQTFPERSRDRFLDADELKRLWAALDAERFLAEQDG